MRTRTRLVTSILIGGLVVAALPAHAAKPKPQVTDPSGDANGVNDQALGAPVPSAGTGPASLAAADITGVTFATTFGKKKVHRKTVKVVKGFTVTMALAAAPSLPNIIYRVSAAAAGCGTDVFFEYTSGGDTQVRCPNEDVTKDSTTYTSAPAVVKDKTITWSLPVSAFPAGTSFSTLNAQTRQVTSSPVVSLTAPQYDYASSNATFTVGK